jgi:hypothetical protein
MKLVAEMGTRHGGKKTLLLRVATDGDDEIP